MSYLDKYMSSLFVNESFIPSLHIMKIKGLNSLTLTRCNDRCQNNTSFNLPERYLCLRECEITNFTGIINDLNRIRGRCSDHKDPPNCVERINKTINKMKERLRKKQERVQKIRSFLRIKQ